VGRAPGGPAYGLQGERTVSVEPKIPTFIQTTDTVEQKHSFDFWRDVVLTGVDVTPFESDAPFSACRMVAPSAHGTILRTVSTPVGVDRTARHIGRDGRDEIAIMVVAAGQGYIEQGSNGALLQRGDVAFHATGRPGIAGSRYGYEEIRLAVPRASFMEQVGNPQVLTGSKLNATPLRGLLAAHLDAFATSVSGMTEVETGIAIEGALHILRGIVHGQHGAIDGRLSVDAVRSLALSHIQRRLHETAFGPASLAASLQISRSRLYAAFAGGEGIAATIRDARLDRAHDRIVMMRKTGARVASIMASCGFTDPATFSRAFRRRFGFTPRDLLSQGVG